MSGHKHATITISQDEYRRLHELDMEQRFRNNKKSEDSNARYNALWDAYRDIEDRQKEYEEIIASLNEDIANFEAEQSSEVISVQAEYYQSLVDQLQEIQEENIGVQTALEETARYFEAVIQSEQTKAQQRFHALLQQISVITQDQNTKEDQAREWIENCTQLSNFINEQYDHEKFFPKEFDHILTRLNLAIHNLNQGNVDSGLQFAQEVFLRFSELRVSLEEKTAEWLAVYQISRDEVQRLYSDVSNTKVIPAIGVDGEQLHVDIELDYWSSGKYSNLQNRLSTVSTMIENCKQEITFQDLEKLSNEILPKFKKEFNVILFEARQNAINSQIKINIAYLAMKALEKHGFSLKQGQYEDGDMREAFSAELCDEFGSNIIVQVTPNNNSQSNNLIIDTIDDTIHTEDEYMQRWREINDSLEEAGVQVGQVQVSHMHERTAGNMHPQPGYLKKPFKNPRTPYYVQPYLPSTSTSHS